MWEKMLLIIDLDQAGKAAVDHLELAGGADLALTVCVMGYLVVSE